MEKKQIKKLSFSFLPIPEELMRSKAISFGAKFLFGIIAKTNLERVKFKKKTLAEKMGCEGREVQRRVKELKDSNLIIVKGDPGRSNFYSVNLEMLTIIQKESDILEAPTESEDIRYPELNEKEKVVRKLFKKQRGKCAYCKKKIILVDKFKSYTFDESLKWGELEHITPKSKGGKDELSNYCLACRGCNQRKGASIWTPLKDVVGGSQSQTPRGVQASDSTSKEVLLKKIIKEGDNNKKLKRYRQIKTKVFNKTSIPV